MQKGRNNNDKKRKTKQGASLLGLLTSLQGGLGKLGEDKASLVDLRVVVAAELDLLLLGPLTGRLLDVGTGILGANHETDLTAGVGGDGDDTVLDTREQLAGKAHNLLDDG